MVRSAKGVVTINSTAGALALNCNVPVITLGQAIYDMPGITDSGTLDHFWGAPTPPDPITFEDFRRVLIDRCLIEGGFFSPEGLQLLVQGTLRRVNRTALSENGKVFTISPRDMSVSASQ